MGDETMKGSALARALAKAQAVMQSASKDKTNPAFRSRYADLASVWDACREALTTNGLAVAQLVTSADKSSVTVETRLLHESGESLSSILTLPVEKATAQGVGSAITYARRYGLSAMVGVAPDDDDDGNEASRPAQQTRRADAERVAAVLAEAASNVVAMPVEVWRQRIAEAQTCAELAELGRRIHREAAPLLKALGPAWTARNTELAARERAVPQ